MVDPEIEVRGIVEAGKYPGQVKDFIIEAEKRGYTPFICGISNTNDVDKMPVYVYVCAGLGSEQVVRYEKVVT